MAYKCKTTALLLSCLSFSQVSFSATELFLRDQQIRVSQDLNDFYSFNPIKKITLPNGKIKYKLNQTYKNTIVKNSVVVTNKLPRAGVSFSARSNRTVFGHILTNIENDLDSTNPTLTSNQALEIAKQTLSLNKSSILNNPKINLYIINHHNVARLVYEINFFLDGSENSGRTEPTRPFIVLDANNGEILEQWDGLTSLNFEYTAGPGGNEKIGKYFYGTDYGKLQVTKIDTESNKKKKKKKKNTDNIELSANEECQMQSENVMTYDKKNKKSIDTKGAVLLKFNCAENTYKAVNGGYSPINDAHYFGEIVFKMYKDWFNTSPLDSILKLYAHYGINHDNAYWNGEIMLFGDGGDLFYPLVSLDVIAHEVSHGFTEQNSNLAYRGESGGINESFSDISGEAAKYFMNNGKENGNDWMVGANIFKGDGALRYFKDPKKDGKSIDHKKDFKRFTNPHYSSGIFNKAFYLLATSKNWDVKKAYHTFVVANQLYWTSTATFDKAACGITKAAKDLEYNIDDVKAAFEKVGVDAEC